MKIVAIDTHCLYIPYTRPYFWANGRTDGAELVLVEVRTDDGVVGYGECIGSPRAEDVKPFVDQAAALCVGADPAHHVALMARAYERIFQAGATCSQPRFAGQVLAGLEMALWDVVGKSVGLPVHDLLGGPVRTEIRHFGFAQGESVDEVVADARDLVDQGFPVIYLKVGRSDQYDLDVVTAVRQAVGPRPRLRVDPNEHWTQVQARRMLRRLVELDVEVVEQPTDCESIAALAQLRRASPIPVSADQAVFTPYDVYDVCREQAADLIVLGLHETGGIWRFLKAAHIAEAAGVNICLHGLHESGITTCATNQAASVLPNLDDANQHMGRFLEWDLVHAAGVLPVGGVSPVLTGPGLGFEIDESGVARAKEAFQRRRSAR